MQATRFLSFKKKEITKWLVFLDHPLGLVQTKEPTEQVTDTTSFPSAGSTGVSIKEATASFLGRGEEP